MNVVETSSCSDFQTVDLDKKHKCFRCCKYTEVKMWKCRCDTRWHICKQHRYNNNAIPEKPKSHMSQTARGQTPHRTKNNSSKAQKRKLTAPQSYDEILADDIKRANKKTRPSATNRKRKSDVALGELTHTGVKPSFLGPILSRRFMEADNSSTLQ